MPRKGKAGQADKKKTSLMGITFSKKRTDMSKTLPSQDLDGVAEYIKSRNPKNIVFCVGAGISTNAGIPDFRSPETGLYVNLEALKLPYPEAVFSLQYFRQDPQPFYTLAETLYPGAYKPTLTHSFIRLVQDKSILLRCFTQNIDTLERMAGVKPHLILEAHGSFATSRCIDCRDPFPNDKIKQLIQEKKIPRCPECDGLVKPDIVFFGESLPEEFWARRHDMHLADLVFVIGTSLQVRPFAMLPGFTFPSVPRVLLNKDRVEGFSRLNDVSILGDCDESIWQLCQKLGWDEELKKLHEEIGGVDRDWKVDTKKTEDEAVEELAKQLSEELRLDKDEDEDEEIQQLRENLSNESNSDKDKNPSKPENQPGNVDLSHRKEKL